MYVLATATDEYSCSRRPCQIKALKQKGGSN